MHLYDSTVGKTHLVIEEDSENGRHHTQHVGERDRVAQHQQRYTDDHDPLGGVGDGVAERADEVQNTESDDVLGKITEAADEEEEEGAGPSRNIRLKGRQRLRHTLFQVHFMINSKK